MIPLRREHRFSKFLRFLGLVSAVLTACCITVIANDPKHPDPWQSESSNEHKQNEKADIPVNIEKILKDQPKADTSIDCPELYILVSTIDGKVTALDLHNHGSLLWAVEADHRPLYSSSLANMEIIRKGKKLRVIPSLDGALYQYDGEKVEAVPMSAETLLSNTYRLSDDSMVVGSKDIRNYGIDVKTGEIQYVCGSEGCKSKKGHVDEADDALWNDVVVLTRTTQVVRSVEIKNGVEKWNFSVGQHEVNLPPQKDRPQIDADDSDDDSSEYVTTEDEEYIWTPKQTNEKCSAKFPEDLDIEDSLRLIVPEGKVIALSKDDSASGIRWEHKFECPIAKAWLLREGKIEPMNLFDGRHLPTLGTAFEPEDLENESMHQPLLYIGSHQKLLYIQPSPKMESLLKSFPNQRVGHVFDANLKVSWRPYLNTASFRTPIFGGNRPAIAAKPDPDKSDKTTHALTVWHEDYPFDTGYFLYPDYLEESSQNKKWPSFDQRTRRPRIAAVLEDTLLSSVRLTWFSLILILGLIAGSTYYLFKWSDQKSLQFTVAVEEKIESAAKSSSSDSILSTENNPDVKGMYTSRFATDFECLQCLGKGGFGIVFEAVHKFDNVHYAVKRTMLPNSEGAREKVRREHLVLAQLAKLEHRGIIRYFNAWMESPPKGWQEEQDKKILPSEYTGTSLYSDDTKTSFCAERDHILPDQGLEATLDEDSGLLQSDGMFSELGKGDSGEFDLHSVRSSDSYGSYPDFDTSNIAESKWVKVNSVSSSSCDRTQSNIPDKSARSRSSKGQQNFKESNEFTNDSIVFEESSSPVSNLASKSGNLEYSAMSDDSIVFEESGRLVKNDKLFGYSGATEDSVCFDSSSNLNSNKLFEYTNMTNDSIVFEETSNAVNHLNTNITDPLWDKTVSEPGTKDHTVDISTSCCEETSHHKPSETKHFLYIQMQLCKKDTLKDWLNNTLNRDKNTIINIFAQLVEAVDYLHNQGLMHRDLKPSNIFFSDDGLVKIGDFGLVTSLVIEQDEGNQPVSNTHRHTAEVGTTLYMSPEQISKQPYDFKVDIFSLGLILLELCIPFSTQSERIRSILDVKRQVFPSSFVSECPVESDLVKQMTSPVSAQRPTAGDILEHKFLVDFVEPILGHRRSRSRTISNNSNNS